MSRTYALLGISLAAYEEIYALLDQAGYQQAFHAVDGHTVIDMHGIAVRGPLVRPSVKNHEEIGMPVGTQVQLHRWRWKGHKEVWADRIKAVIVLSPIDERTPPTDHDVTILLDGGGEIGVSKTFIAHGIPSIGDFFVQEENGNQSWCSRKAFEAGYAQK
mgnify:FL=1